MNVQNQHFMGAIVGREGFGKSHTAVRIAEGVDPTFTADRVFFDPQDLLRALDDEKLGAGNVIVLDEAGVGMGNRSWYEKEQILLNQALQTARDDNMGILFTLPRLEELDSQTIGRLHAFIEMTGVYPDQGFAEGKWKNISLTRDGRGNEYKKYPKLRVGGTPTKVKRLTFSPPTPEIVQAYEQRKEEFKAKLYQEAIGAYEEQKEKKSDGMSPREIAKEITDDGVEPFLSEHGTTGEAYINKNLIREEYGLSHSDARTVKSLLEQAFGNSELNDKL